MHHGTSRGKPKGIPRAGSAMTRRRGSAMTHIRMTVDSRVLGHPQSRQINPNRGPSRAPTGLNPPPSPNTPLYWERRLISCFCFASHVGHLFRWAPGTRSALTGRRLAVSFPAGRDAVKARDALLGQCPLGQPRGVRRRGYSPTDTAHEMRIPLRPLRMSKPYRRLRKRTLRSDEVEALLELSVPTVSPSSET